VADLSKPWDKVRKNGLESQQQGFRKSTTKFGGWNKGLESQQQN